MCFLWKKKGDRPLGMPPELSFGVKCFQILFNVLFFRLSTGFHAACMPLFGIQESCYEDCFHLS